MLLGQSHALTTPLRAHAACLSASGLGLVALALMLPAGGALGAGQSTPAGLADKSGAGRTVATAHYLANEGVLITSGDTKIAFDPLFRKGYGQYQLLPPELERALFAGEAPFQGLDAVFVSHYHEDHFSPADLRRLLQEQPGVRLYAPAQAVATMDLAAGGASIRSRITPVDIAVGDPPFRFEEGTLRVETVRIPHAGWPDRNRDVQNLAWRVTLDGAATVVHLGDADARDVHFSRDAAYWQERPPQVAFPPYWFFLGEEGPRVLEQRIAPGHAVGIHVPTDMPRRPEQRPEALRGRDLFLVPGETREIRE